VQEQSNEEDEKDEEHFEGEDDSEVSQNDAKKQVFA
jgi:hypothetical protein